MYASDFMCGIYGAHIFMTNILHICRGSEAFVSGTCKICEIDVSVGCVSACNAKFWV